MRLAQFRMLGADAGSFRSPTLALSSRPRRAMTGLQQRCSLHILPTIILQIPSNCGPRRCLP